MWVRLKLALKARFDARGTSNDRVEAEEGRVGVGSRRKSMKRSALDRLMP